jgi:hypothetical protein
MATGDVKATDLPPEVDDWLELLKGLVDNVKAWAEAAGWETRLTGRDVNEKGVVRYEVPVLAWIPKNALSPNKVACEGGGSFENFRPSPDWACYIASTLIDT